LPVAANNAKRKAGREKDGRQRRGYLRQQVCGGPPGYEATSAAAHAKRAALGALQQDEHDHREGGHDMNDEKNCSHRSLSGRNLGEICTLHDRFSFEDQASKCRAAARSKTTPGKAWPAGSLNRFRNPALLRLFGLAEAALRFRTNLADAPL
jgi:hypothetical protein